MKYTIHKLVDAPKECVWMDSSLFNNLLQAEIKKIEGTLDSNVRVCNNGFYTFIYCVEGAKITRIDIDNSSL